MTNREQHRNIMRMDILKAFERCLLNNSGYVEVGISEICAEAHISKPTFYRYFQNKESIVKWISKIAIRCGVVEIGRTCSWLEGYYRTSLMQYKHRAIFCDRQSLSLTTNLIDFSARYQREALIETITVYHGQEITEQLSFQIEALMLAEGFMSRRWGESGMTIPPRTIAEYLTSIVPHDLFKLLDDPKKTPGSAPCISPNVSAASDTIG